MNAMQAQYKLLLLGFNPGPIDGLIGNKTLSAIEQFVKKYDSETYSACENQGDERNLTLIKVCFRILPNVKLTKSLPIWLKTAAKYLGEKEIKGSQHNPFIIEWWKAIKSKIIDDETSWCAAFVGGILEETGIMSTRSESARSYNKWGLELDRPAYGSIVVFWRGKPSSWKGHVGFVVGRDQHNNLMVLGGNQKDQVCISSFSALRVLSYRWPATSVYPTKRGFGNLPLISSIGSTSKDEV